MDYNEFLIVWNWQEINEISFVVYCLLGIVHVLIHTLCMSAK